MPFGEIINSIKGIQGRRQAPLIGSSKNTFGTMLLEALLEAGIPAALVLVTLLYSTRMSSYWTGKSAVLHIVVGILTTWWLWLSVLRGRLLLERSPLYWTWLIYIIASLVALGLAVNPGQGVEVLLEQVWLFVLYLLVIHHFRDSSGIIGILWCMSATAGIVACFGLLQYHGVHILPRVDLYADLPISTLGNPNIAAHYLEMMVPVTLGLLLARRRWVERLLLVLVLGLVSYHLLVCESRAGWLAVSVGLCTWGVLSGRGRVLKRWIGLGVLIIALLSPSIEVVLEQIYIGEEQQSLDKKIVTQMDHVWERLSSAFDLQNFSVAQRLIIWNDSLDLIKERWALGVGPGNYAMILPAYRTVERHRAWKELMGERTNVAYHAHNEYLEYWAESGLGGLLAMLAMLGLVIWTGYRSVQGNLSPANRSLTFGCLAAQIAALVHSVFSFNLRDPVAGSHFWVLAGVVIVLARPLRHNAPEKMYEFFLTPLWRKGLALFFAGVLGVLGVYMGVRIIIGDLNFVEGQIMWKRNQHPNRASLVLQDAISWRSHDFRYYHELAEAHMGAERYEMAEQSFYKSLRYHPNNPGVMRRLASTFYQQNKFSSAIKALNQAIALEPLNPRSYKLIGQSYRLLGKYGEAVLALEQAQRFKPEDSGVQEELWRAYQASGQLDRAIEVLEKLLQADSADGIKQGNLGLLYMGQQRLSEAENHLKRALVQAPLEQVNWYIGLVQVYYFSGQEKKAWQALEAALALEHNPRIDQLRKWLENKQHP